MVVSKLDDLITIHLMEDGEASTTSKETALIALLNQPAEDNSDATGLDTDGYQLNGAFKMDVDRASGIPKLNPTPELLAVCPFNPPRPSGTSAVESCITRRDVQERRFPTRAGAGQPTAMEILKETAAVLEGQDLADERAALLEQKTAGVAPFNACTCTVGTACCEAAFLGGILGDSDFARDLAVDFVNAIDLRYALNGRWTRGESAFQRTCDAFSCGWRAVRVCCGVVSDVRFVLCGCDLVRVSFSRQQRRNSY